MNLAKQNYKAWLVKEKDFPKTAPLKEKIAHLVSYGVLAPSTHNTQPWLFEIEDGYLVVKPDFSKSLDAADVNKKGLYLSLGMCVENIVQAARHFGLATEVATSAHEVRITFRETQSTRGDDSILESIKNRHTNKQIYTHHPAPDEFLTELAAINETQYGKFMLLADRADIEMFSQLHTEATEAVAKNVDFVKELARWLRPNNTNKFDGMPGYVVGNSLPKSILAGFVLNKKPGLFRKATRQEGALVESSSMVMIFTAKKDNPPYWIECGRLVERAWLKITKAGLAAQPITASVANDWFRERLTARYALEGMPVFVMRAGYAAKPSLPTPRRIV